MLGPLTLSSISRLLATFFTLAGSEDESDGAPEVFAGPLLIVTEYACCLIVISSCNWFTRSYISDPKR